MGVCGWIELLAEEIPHMTDNNKQNVARTISFAFTRSRMTHEMYVLRRM
jgi:hypothetical protein